MSLAATPAATPATEGPAPMTGLPVLPAHAVPAALRTGAAFAAFFGTLWLVQGLIPVVGLPAAAAGALPGLAVAAHLVATRGAARPAVPDDPADPAVPGAARRAHRYVTRATVAQLVVSVPGAVLVELLADRTLVLPFVIATVGAYLLALAPVVRRPHLAVTGAVLAVLAAATPLAFDGTARTVVVGLAGGAVFLAKAVVDLVVSRRP